jgi:hypothetical protein
MNNFFGGAFFAGDFFAAVIVAAQQLLVRLRTFTDRRRI